MRSEETNTTKQKIESRWDGLNTLERVKMILTHPDHFLAYGLITDEEYEKARSAGESELEYVAENAPELMFHTIDLNKNITAQNQRKLFKTALKAVFL